jgi:hypothetical protein
MARFSEATGVPVVLVQADARNGRSRALLAAAGLGRAESWSTANGLDEYLRASIDPMWAGELPHSLMVAADGTVTAARGAAQVASLRTWAARAARQPATKTLPVASP